ncbi:hypothetical protein GMLC_21090 [Geomonas limicola]|uniref:Glycosyltransferase 2-like domain-containing protein n=1 Tax=Geomonas limicola TaxID=2740186 RepID=A0A6V8N816_9BACT|nr:tetratricopeptide repeat protein [Geomonas limicola]GFO68530.1 hypothetical protein GMLC_21090 [Geomonas limicola]
MRQLVNRPAGEMVAGVVKRPLISVILVTRNKESYLRECLNGLMEQTVAQRMEVIVVDQGSEQSEWSVVVDLQRRYANLVAVRTAADEGAGAGLNLALKIASGSYLTVLEPSDRLRSDAYELLVNTLESRPDAMLAYGDTCFTAIPHETFANHTSYGKMIWPHYSAQQLLQLSLIAPHPVWRRELNDAVGAFDAKFQCEALRHFLLRVVDNFTMLHVEEFVGLRLVETGTSLGQEGSQRELADLKQNYPATGRQCALPVTAAPASSPSTEIPPQPAQAFVAPAAAAPAPQAPLSAEAAYRSVEELVAAGATGDALEALREHLVRYPDHAQAHNDYATLLVQQDDAETALSHYRRAVALAPQENTYRKNLADLLFVAAGEVDEAIAIYLDLHQKEPRDTETLTNLGVICETVGQPDEAKIFYQRVLDIEPWNQEVRQRICQLRETAAAAEDDEETAEERYERVQGLVSEGDLSGAARELETTLKSYPGFAPAHNDLAVLSYQEGDKEKALHHYEQAAVLAPGNSTFQKNLADFYFVEGHDVDGAIAIYLKLLEKEPKNIETLMNLGKICTVLERPEEAKSFYGKVTQLEPWNQDARECLANLRQVVNG